MDIKDPFIQKVLRGDCSKFTFEDVKNFVDRNEDDVQLLSAQSKGKKKKMLIVVQGVDRSPRIPFIKVEKQHGKGDKYIHINYIRDLVTDLTIAGHIPEEDD